MSLYPTVLTFGANQTTPVYTNATTGYSVYIDDEMPPCFKYSS